MSGFCPLSLAQATGGLAYYDLSLGEKELADRLVATGVYLREGSWIRPSSIGGVRCDSMVYRYKGYSAVCCKGNVYLYELEGYGPTPIAIRHVVGDQWYCQRWVLDTNRRLSAITGVSTRKRRKEWFPLDGLLVTPYAIAKAAWERPHLWRGLITVDMGNTLPYSVKED